MPMLKLRDREFYYEEQGSGDPLILICGISCDHTFLAPIIEPLSKHFRLILFDNRGVGKTKYPDCDFTIEEMAEDTWEIINALDLKKPHVFGDSMGGAIAQALYRKHHASLGRLVLCATFPRVSGTFYRAMDAQRRLIEAGVDPALSFTPLIPWFRSNASCADDKIMKEVEQAYIDNPVNIKGYLRQMKALSAFDSRSWLHEIEGEVLICAGDEDLLISKTDASMMVKLIPHCHLALMPAPHSLVYEMTDDLCQETITFLEQGKLRQKAG